MFGILLKYCINFLYHYTSLFLHLFFPSYDLHYYLYGQLSDHKNHLYYIYYYHLQSIEILLLIQYHLKPDDFVLFHYYPYLIY